MGISRIHRFALILLLALFAVETPAAPTVVGYQLVSKKRSGRTTVDYTYRVRVRNQGNPYSSIVLTATSSSATTSILEADVYLTFIDSNETVRTDDTFTIRQDRLQRSNLASITWQIDGEAIVPSTEPVEIVAANFVEFAGAPEHGGWVPIDGHPVANPNEPGMLRLDLTGPIAGGRIDVLGTDHTTLATAALVPVIETRSILTDYFASVVVPAEPFTVRLIGTDTRGLAVSDLWPVEYSPARVSLRVNSLSLSNPAGTTLVLPVLITNLGDAQRFRLQVTSSSARLTVSPTVSELQLSPGQIGTSDLTVEIATDSPPFSQHSLVMTVSSLADPSNTDQTNAVVEVIPLVPSD